MTVDGVLDEPDWQRAEPIPLAWEFLPGDNVTPQVETICNSTRGERMIKSARPSSVCGKTRLIRVSLR
jgi:hypothetical protein